MCDVVWLHFGAFTIVQLALGYHILAVSRTHSCELFADMASLLSLGLSSCQVGMPGARGVGNIACFY